MKILHVISSFETGGAQKLLFETIMTQLDSGLDVSVLVYRTIGSIYEKSLIEKGCELISLDESNIKSLRIIPELRRNIRKFDIIHVHLFPPLYQMALANIGINRKIIFTEHSTFNKRRNHPFLRPIEKLIYSRYDSVIAISYAVKESLVKWLGLGYPASDKVRVINNGVDLEAIRNSVPISDNILMKPYILMVSRFMPAKDQATLIKSIPYIKSKEIEIVFAGDGVTLGKNKDLAKTLGVDNRCHFLGNRENVAPLIKGCLIGVQSSHWEGFGLTAVEMMAAGKPVIASDIPGLGSVVDGAGLLFRQGDERDLADKINKLLEDPAKYESCSKACLERSEVYDIANMTKSYEQLYLSCRNDRSIKDGKTLDGR